MIADRLRRQPPFVWAVLAIGALLFALYAVVVNALVQAGGSERASGWSVTTGPQHQMRVTHVEADGPAAGKLLVGDVIQTVNARPALVRGLGWVLFMDLHPGDAYSVRVARGSSIIDYSLVMTARPNLQKLWLVQVPLLIISLVFSATGLAVGLIAARDRVARLYAIGALLIGALLIPNGVFIGDALHGGSRAALSTAAAFTPFVFPMIYHFLLEFPPGVAQTRVWSLIKIFLYAWGTALFPLTVATHIAANQGTERASALINTYRDLFTINDEVSTWFVTSACVAMVAVIVRNYFAVVDQDQRRRLRWVFLGLVIAAAPVATIYLVNLLGVVSGSEMDVQTWFRAQTFALLFLVFLPVTFSYAVIAHRVVGVEVVIRQGLRYLLARNVLRGAIFLPIILLGLRVVSDPDRTVSQILFDNPFYSALALAAAFGLFVRDRLQRWLDRRFFRDAHDGERLLLELVSEIKQHDSLGDLVALVSRRIERALHPQQVHLFLIDNPLDRLSVGEGGRLPPDSAIARLLGHQAVAHDVPFPPATLPAHEAEWLESLGARLAVPIGGGDERLVGLLLVGEKKAEEPYSREDRRLLEAVARQITIVYENAMLKRAAVEDARVKQEVLARVDASGLNLLKECPHCGTCYDRADETCVRDGKALTLSLPIDRTIDGKYRLEQLLGRGGMGTVYSATDLRLGRSVAVKLLRSSTLASDQARRRFDREARASARLHHPNIITVYDYGNTGHDVAYLVMERLVGTTLRAEIQRRGRLQPAVAAVWFEQILDGVCAAHSAGIIHRDLKPENVMVVPGERGAPASIKLLDFGLAKLKLADPDESRSLTDAGAVVGTLAYMSPEQLSGAPVDQRTDFFAIGVMVVEALTGRNPFRKDDPRETVSAILNDRAGIDGEDPSRQALDQVLQHCVAKPREQRFASARELQEALIPALRSCLEWGPLSLTTNESDPTVLG